MNRHKGFESLPPERRRELARRGGRASHERGTAHEWTGGRNGSAAAAGRKGGFESHRRRRERLASVSPGPTGT